MIFKWEVVMDVSRERSSGRADRIAPASDRDFLASLMEALGPPVQAFLDRVRPPGPAAPSVTPLGDMPPEIHGRMRMLVAADAMRSVYERHHQVEMSFAPDGSFEIWPSGRLSRPPGVMEQAFFEAATALPGAMGIMALVHGRLGRDASGFYAHLPIGLASNESSQLITLMSIRPWRKAVEMRYSLFSGFRTPFHVAAARSIDHPALRNFVSIEEQARSGFLFPSS